MTVRSCPLHNQARLFPAPCAWPVLLAKNGDAPFDHYCHTLDWLGKQPGAFARIFGKAQNKFQDPAKL